MNEYELMTILSPRLSAEESTALVESIEEQIRTHGGEVLSTDVWGRQRLAYAIGAATEGTYVLFTLRLPPEGAAPVESGLRLSERVLRHLLIRGIIPYQGRDRDRDRDYDRDDDRGSDRDRAEDGDETAEAEEREQPVAVAVAAPEAEAEAADAPEVAPADDEPAATAEPGEVPDNADEE